MPPALPADDSPAFAAMQRLLDALDGIAWIVDTEGVVRAVGVPNWTRFAAANGGSQIAAPSAVIGRPLADFVIGDEVRAFYRRVIDVIRFGGQEIAALPAGCDAPEIGREMRLTLSPIRMGGAIEGILFQSVTLTEHQRPPVNLYDFASMYADLERRRALPALGMCSVCQRVLHPPGAVEPAGQWIKAEEHYRRGGDSMVRIEHRVCADCRAEYGEPT